MNKPMNEKLKEVLSTWATKDLNDVNSLEAVMRNVIASWMMELESYYSELRSNIRVIETSDAILPPLINNLPSGCKIKQIDESNKARIVFTGKDFFSISDEPKDVPMKWFRKEFINAINTQINFVTEQNGSWNKYSLNQNDFIIKMLMMCRTSESREFWSARLDTLVRYPHYNIDCIADNTSDNFARPVEMHIYDIKEEHADKCFYKIREEYQGVFTKYHGPVVFSMEEPKKALARNSRLVETPDAVYIGKHTCYVLDDVPEVHLQDGTYLPDYFVTGSGYTPTPLLEKLGGMRITNPYGLKFTTMPMPRNVLFPEDKEGVILSKQSFKSGLNGIVIAQNDLDLNQLIEPLARMEGIKYIDKSKAESMCESIEVNFLGVPLKAYKIEMDMYASDFYVLYGLRKVSESVKNIAEDEEGNVNDTNSSYYLWARDQIAQWANDIATDVDASQFDLIGDIMSRLRSKTNSQGDLRYVRRTIGVKTQEFTVARFSYGETIAYDWMSSVLEAARVRGNTAEALDFQTKANELPYEEYSKQDVFDNFINGVFKGIRIINPGKIDPEDMECDDYDQRITWLLHGGHTWSGLLSNVPKKFYVEGKSFYIPSGHTMKEYIHFEEGSSRIFFSGPAASFLKLIITIKRGKYANWDLKNINHSIDLQKDMLGKTIDNFTVTGGHFTMLPAPWLKAHECSFASNVFGFESKTKRVTFSKMPVLFNSAINDVEAKTKLPKEIFGNLTPALKLGLRSMMFMNVQQLIDHQNDTDGDQGRISLTGGILPLYKGLPDYMHQWRNEYASDEYDLKLKYKEYLAYPRCQHKRDTLPLEISLRVTMHDAVIESSENKAYVGKGTNDLFASSFMLEVYKKRGILGEKNMIMIHDAYAIGMQLEVVRGIKHKSKAEGNFKTAKFSSMFYSTNADMRIDARTALKELVLETIHVNLDIAIENMFYQWDIDALIMQGKSPMAIRRSATHLSEEGRLYLSQCPAIENDFKVLDCMTRSYLSNVSKGMPTYAKMNNQQKLNLVNACHDVLMNSELYLNKYCVLGQDMSKYAIGTTLCTMFKMWKEKNSLEYSHSFELRSQQITSEQFAGF